MKVRIILKGYIQNPNGDFDERFKTVLVEIPEDKCDFSIFKEIVGGEIIRENERIKESEEM